MSILELRILPPLAIARLGSSPHPLENYELELSENGLDFRRIVPASTFYVDAATGEIADARIPDVIRFRDGDHIRPVAPFLEVYARTSDGTFAPLTAGLLQAKGLATTDVRWTVEVGNIKAFRRTGDNGDKAIAKVSFSDHLVHALDATASNFLPGKVLPLGTVRYIKPNTRFPQSGCASLRRKGSSMARAISASRSTRTAIRSNAKTRSSPGGSFTMARMRSTNGLDGWIRAMRRQPTPVPSMLALTTMTAIMSVGAIWTTNATG
jgi:hypothetical protein